MFTYYKVSVTDLYSGNSVCSPIVSSLHLDSFITTFIENGCSVLIIKTITKDEK